MSEQEELLLSALDRLRLEIEHYLANGIGRVFLDDAIRDTRAIICQAKV
jgi:hypothetical protein